MSPVNSESYPTFIGSRTTCYVGAFGRLGWPFGLAVLVYAIFRALDIAELVCWENQRSVFKNLPQDNASNALNGLSA